MCGIAGLTDFAGPVDDVAVRRMCARLEHRGPDSDGFHVEPGVAIGIRRLAVIDIAGGEQPVFNEDGTVVVVMNGEIYNHDELRRSLRARGHTFQSRCDTEVLVHLYEEYGDRMVERLRGMFAFAVWDRGRRRFLCARDRVGKKPLFWARSGSRFWFASELRALLEAPGIDRTVDPRAIDAYLALQYIPHPLCVFRGVQKLPPASTLVVDETGAKVERYWRLDHSRKLTGCSEAELQDRTWDALKEATRVRLMSDVPLGAFLSGGVDSSAVVAAMAEQMAEPVKTFSIGFADRDFDELEYARMVAKHFGTDHHEFRVEPDAVSVFPRIARQYGEPFADPSAIPSFYLSELTRQHVTVALNGDGGDESFGGYGRYLRGLQLGRLDWLPDPLQRTAGLLALQLGSDEAGRGVRTKMARLGTALNAPAWERYSMSLTAFDRSARERLLSPEFRRELAGWRGEQFVADAWAGSGADTDLERMMDTDIETYLPGDLLPKVDIATMAYSLEARSPFLDHQLMEFAASVPADLKLAGGETKRLLKATMRGRIPDAVLDRPKMGFGVPIGRWFREDLRNFPKETLLDPGALAGSYFNRGELERLIDDHQAGSADHSLRIWVLVQLELWHREVLDQPGAELTPARETHASPGS